MAGRQLAALVLSDAERRELTSLAARRNTAQALALRARIVLRAHDSPPDSGSVPASGGVGTGIPSPKVVSSFRACSVRMLSRCT